MLEVFKRTQSLVEQAKRHKKLADDHVWDAYMETGVSERDAAFENREAVRHQRRSDRLQEIIGGRRMRALTRRANPMRELSFLKRRLAEVRNTLQFLEESALDHFSSEGGVSTEHHEKLIRLDSREDRLYRMVGKHSQ